MTLSIEKNNAYAESNITVIGITKEAYGRPQYILVNSDGGANRELKFPGLRFRAPVSQHHTLEDVAKDRFEEQTGLTIDKMLGLRTIVPTRSRHGAQWIFRNVFLATVNDFSNCKKPDGARKVYLAESGQGRVPSKEQVSLLGYSRKKESLKWVTSDNQAIARIATDTINTFNWGIKSTRWYRQIPCIGAPLQTNTSDRPLGCALAVASIFLLYQPNEHDAQQIILLKRKGDEHPGYAGGKIETLNSTSSLNIDPISCCAKEGAEEFGFPIIPKALICCSITPLDVPGQDSTIFYNSIINYAFVAEPVNALKVEKALNHPEKYLEDKMEAYIVENLDAHKDRILQKKLRMPDMPLIGEQFYRTSPGDKIPLTQIVFSGCR